MSIVVCTSGMIKACLNKSRVPCTELMHRCCIWQEAHELDCNGMSIVTVRVAYLCKHVGTLNLAVTTYRVSVSEHSVLHMQAP